MALVDLKPIWRLRWPLPPFVVLLRTADIREVLELDKGFDPHFSVIDYGKRMEETVGAFFLGMDQSGDYDAEQRLAFAAFRNETRHDGFALTREELTNLAYDKSSEIVKDLKRKNKREIDVVKDLANVVPMHVFEHYFGIAPRIRPPGENPDDEIENDRLASDRLLQDFQEISFYIFNPLSEIPVARWLFQLKRRAEDAGSRIQEVIRDQVEERWKWRQGNPGQSDEHVLDRLLTAVENEAQLKGNSVGKRDLDLVRRILTGLMSGSTVPMVGTFVSVIDRLMDLPASVRRDIQFAALAAAGNRGDESLWRFLREGGRFGPVPRFTLRRCVKEHTVAQGCARARTIRPGQIALLAPVNAGRDPFTFTHPVEFNLDRPAGSYMLFGHGLHQCLGEFLGQIMMIEMAAQLFSLRGLERDAERGRRQTHRSAPKSLVLNFLPGTIL